MVTFIFEHFLFFLHSDSLLRTSLVEKNREDSSANLNIENIEKQQPAPLTFRRAVGRSACRCKAELSHCLSATDMLCSLSIAGQGELSNWAFDESEESGCRVRRWRNTGK